MLVSCLHQTFQSCVLLNWFESLSIIQFKCGFFFSFRHNAHSSEKRLPLPQKGCTGLGDERPGFPSYRTSKGLSNSLVALQLRFSFVDGERNLRPFSVLEAVSQIKGADSQHSAWQG